MDKLEILNNFKRNTFHVCGQCGHDEIVVRVTPNRCIELMDYPEGYYCYECTKKILDYDIYENNYSEIMSSDFVIEYSCCYECREANFYGKIYDGEQRDHHGSYVRLCKKCFIYELENFGIFNVKPAKR